MAKKKSTKAQGKQPVKKAERKAAPSKPEPMPSIVVFYELSGVPNIRYHSEYSDLQRARITAQTLVSSADISQAWIVRDVEIFRSSAS